MTCPECGGELSKKWNLQSAERVPSDKVIAWNCSVCGGEFTREDVAPASKTSRAAASSES
jgi:hypothetical protein